MGSRLVVVNKLSKYAHFISKTILIQLGIWLTFCSRGGQQLGIPISIVNDKNPTFMINFWKELFKLQGTKLARALPMITWNLTWKLRLSIGLWKHIYVVFRKRKEKGLVFNRTLFKYSMQQKKNEMYSFQFLTHWIYTFL